MEGIPRSLKITVWVGTLAFLTPAFKYACYPVWRNDKKRSDRTAIVTGASGNLGTAITYHLAKRDVRVIMACRDLEKCRMIRRELVLMTGNKGIVCRHLDLEDIDSINKFAKEMKETEPHVDILINNAGLKEVKEKEITKYKIEKNYFVNFVGPYLLTLLLLDKLKEASIVTRDSRVINMVGSIQQNWKLDLDDINFDKRKYDPKTAYRQSKLALAYFTILLEKFNREQKNNIYVYGTSPGTYSIAESLYRPSGLKQGAVAMTQLYSHHVPDRVIQSVIRCALDPTFASKDYGGKLYSVFFTHWGWGGADQDENKAKMVWNSAADLILTPK